jgi:hypothetical protein
MARVTVPNPGTQVAASYPVKGRPSVRWDQDPHIMARIKQVWQLSVQEAMSNYAIADRLGIDVRTVRNDLKRLEQVWAKELAVGTDRLRARKVVELQDVARRALQAYEEDRRHILAVLYDEPFSSHECPGGVSHGSDAMGQPLPSCLEPHRVELRAYRDVKGTATYKGNGAAALNVARQAFMDQAKLLGLVVDKVSPVDGQGNDLGGLINNLFANLTPTGSTTSSLPPGNVVEGEVREMTWACPNCGYGEAYQRGDVKQWPNGKPCPNGDGTMDLDEEATDVSDGQQSS